MKLARIFLSLLMMLLMLTWGAHNGGVMAPTPSGPLDNYVSAQIGELVEKRTDVRFQDPNRASIVKKCSTTTSLGAPCGPDYALPVAMDISWKQKSSVRPLTFNKLLTRGRSVVPPRDPPRTH